MWKILTMMVMLDSPSGNIIENIDIEGEVSYKTKAECTVKANSLEFRRTLRRVEDEIFKVNKRQVFFDNIRCENMNRTDI